VLSASPLLFDESCGGALPATQGNSSASSTSISSMMGGVVGGDAGWIDSTGEIIVTNHSDVAVEINITFVQASTPNGTAVLTVATPSFILESAVGTLSTEAPSSGTNIFVSGIPNGDGIIGKLKVTVKAVSDD